uniref:PGG domain-containing protein n=1 Tax=Nelumbo nucifera TaxID=4432 RepID=A0A822Z7E9_NELNU|nr:TPA_asm: hypothetical protein HUJ06_013652 [Nelumbo nucifera]
MNPKLANAAKEGNITFFDSTDSNFNWVQATPSGNTALHIAMSFGRMDFALRLYQRCQSLLSMRNSDGDTPLHIATRAGHFNRTEVRIPHVVQNNEDPGRILINRHLKRAELRTPQIVQNSEDPERDSINDHINRAELRTPQIVQNNEDPERGSINAPNTTNENKQQRGVHLMEWLERADSGVWSANRKGESLLYLASRQGLQSVVGYALGRLTAPSPNHGGPNGHTALHAAVMGRHSGIIRTILDRMPELIKKQDETNMNSLHYAVLFGDLETVQLLLQRDTSIAYDLDNKGHSPLHKAAIVGLVEIIETLLEYCPDCIDLVDDYSGRNVLHVAVLEKQTEVVQYFCERYHTGFINQVDKEGNTPLHLATINCHVRIAWTLSKVPAVDFTVMNNENLTALNIAELDMEGDAMFQKLIISYILKYYCKYLGNQPEVITTRYAKPDTTKGERTKSETYYKKHINTLIVVSTLIASIAFSAALTLTGGYETDGAGKGTATLVRKFMFKAFVIFDALAICSSINAVYLLVWVIFSDKQISTRVALVATIFVWLSFLALGMAFAAHFYVVLFTELWFAIIITSVVALFPICLPFIPKYFYDSDLWISIILTQEIILLPIWLKLHKKTKPRQTVYG